MTEALEWIPDGRTAFSLMQARYAIIKTLAEQGVDEPPPILFKSGSRVLAFGLCAVQIAGVCEVDIREIHIEIKGGGHTHYTPVLYSWVDSVLLGDLIKILDEETGGVAVVEEDGRTKVDIRLDNTAGDTLTFDATRR